MLARISPHMMNGKVNAMPSKSYAHRILLSAMLSNKAISISGANSSKDVQATINCIQALGSKVQINKDIYMISPNKTKSKSVELDCIESGSTLRFILPIVCALGVNATVVGKEGLMKRPIKDLLDVLRSHGATFDGDSLPLKVSGKITSGEYTIRGDVSSQYITGLLMALPILDGDSSIVIEGEKVSSKYLDITIEVLSEFGIKIKELDNGYYIEGNQKYDASKQLHVQGDWSNAAFWLTLGAINNGIEMNGLSLDSVQGDKEILQILVQMGAQISMEINSIKVKKSRLFGVEVDAKNIPDLVPIISIAMANAEGISTIKNVDRLRIKETNRLDAIIEVLKNMGINVRYSDNELMILGGKPKGAHQKGYNDHRMVMMLAIAASVSSGDTYIEGIEAVNKSYPTFFDDYKKLGGGVSVK